MRIILILLTSFYGSQVIESVNVNNISYCAALDEYYEEKTKTDIPLHGRLRSVFVNDEPQELEVWGGRGAARAAAALLYVIIRYGLRYNTKLVKEDAYFCEITARSWSQAAVVAPAAYWPSTGCNNSQRYIDRFAKLSKPIVKSDLLLYMYLAPDYRSTCEKFQNLTTLLDSNNTKKCNLATSFTVEGLNPRCNDCVAILANKHYDVKINNLNIEITYFNGDFKLRQAMKNLREKNMSFLFIYDYIWPDVNGTYKLPYLQTDYRQEETTDTSFLVGDGIFTNYYAPDINRLLTNGTFTPDTKTLYQILEIEDNKFSLEEAACLWVNKSRDRFERFTEIPMPKYNIMLLVCDRQLIEDVLRTPIEKYLNNNTANIHFDFKVCGYLKTCNNITQLDTCLKSISTTQSLPFAVISKWTDKVSPVVEAAAINNVFLTFASPVPNKISLKTCRSVAGNLFELAQAYHKFFAMSNWYRISVISEDTENAHNFTKALKSSNDFTIKDNIVSDESNILSTLLELKNLNAKIFVLNSGWSLSNKILCEAIELRMTSTEYVWISRDRDVLKCDNSEEDDGLKLLVDNFKHISIGLEWRGGIAPNNDTLFSREEWIQSFDKINNNSHRASDTNWDDFELPSNVFSLAQAIIQSTQAFMKFRNDHFDVIYNLHGSGYFQLMASYFDNFTSHNGSTIYIYEWQRNIHRSLAMWQADDKDVSVKWHLDEYVFNDFLKISDRKKCFIESGDPFSPRCHDIVVVSSGILFILLLISLVIARRLRIARTVKNNLMLLNAVINHRNQVASSLDAFIVERHLVRVYHEIGSGCFGRVHFAELARPGKNTVLVAAKEPYNDIGLEKEHDFLQEASILALLSHDHIIRLIGICIKDGPPMVLMEHALYLDLRRYLTERRHLVSSQAPKNEMTCDDVSDESLTRFVRQAASALEYLASRRLVHRDVRAANCLIDKERSLKLADFGMARRLNGSECEYASHRRALFPVLYMAPESLDEGIFSPATDVWALGVLMLEVVTLGARPFGSWSTARVVRHVSLGGHAPLPPDASIHTRHLALSCWRREPEDRPSAAKIENYLINNPEALSAALLSPNPMTED